MGPRLTYRLELPPDLDQFVIPPMLLQPLVENAIKHGLEPKVGVGSLDVVALRLDAGVEISVTDNRFLAPLSIGLASTQGHLLADTNGG